MLKSELPSYYYYHNYEHTLYVLDKVQLIGRYEKCTDEEIHLLCIAALWHDTGYIKKYHGHEEESCNLAKLYLPDYGYSKEKIELICGMIMATEVPQKPRTKLEMIIADADLEYLGAPNPEAKADDLYHELLNEFKTITPDKWIETQISFLESHHYFTDYCKKETEDQKNKYLERLQKMVP